MASTTVNMEVDKVADKVTRRPTWWWIWGLTRWLTIDEVTLAIGDIKGDVV